MPPALAALAGGCQSAPVQQERCGYLQTPHMRLVLLGQRACWAAASLVGRHRSRQSALPPPSLSLQGARPQAPQSARQCPLQPAGHAVLPLWLPVPHAAPPTAWPCRCAGAGHLALGRSRCSFSASSRAGRVALGRSRCSFIASSSSSSSSSAGDLALCSRCSFTASNSCSIHSG